MKLIVIEAAYYKYSCYNCISCYNWGKPLKDQNRIDLIYHDLKQSIEVKLDEIADQKGIPKEKIPWHSVFCHICKIYRDFKTDVKYMPPRYAHEQDPDMII